MNPALTQLLTTYKLSAHISEKMLRHLSTGRAYTLLELARPVRLSEYETFLYLDELQRAHVMQLRTSRHRKYYFLTDTCFRAELVSIFKTSDNRTIRTGMKYCRHCYSHLGGYVGVKLEQALIAKNYILPNPLPAKAYGTYHITEEGWKWFKTLGIDEAELEEKKGPLTKQCLDFSERRNHLGGKLGHALLSAFFAQNWVEQNPASREIFITPKGRRAFKSKLALSLA